MTDKVEVFVYEDIGAGFFGGITPQEFSDRLAAANALEPEFITLRVNSYGGSVFDGVAMANAIQRNPIPVRAVVDGIAASIASVIAIAAESVEIADTAYMMTHAPWAPAIGHAADLREVADNLDRMTATMSNVYGQRAGIDPAEAIDRFMSGEHWFNAGEAIDAGLADAVAPGSKMAAAFDPAKADWIKNPPAALVAAAQPANRFKLSDRHATRLAAMEKRANRLTAAD